jgi:tRNA G26 N,N-dimethylase Trm1
MIKDLINWFYGLDKPSRKLVVDSFSNENFLKALRSEGFEASQLYLKIKDKV